MDILQLRQSQFIDFMTSMYNEKFLDEQFRQLQKLADESTPDFVYEVVTLFFQDSEKLIENLAKALDQPVVDFNQVANHAHQFKGSSSSIGANRVRNQCVRFRAFCEEQNLEGCLTCLQELQQEYLVLKSKFEYLFELEQEILKNGGTIPPVEYHLPVRFIYSGFSSVTTKWVAKYYVNHLLDILDAGIQLCASGCGTGVKLTGQFVL